MAFKIIRTDSRPTVTATERLYLTEDGELVRKLEGRGTLFCTPGSQIAHDEAAKYGLLDEEPAPEPKEPAPKPKAKPSTRGKSRRSDGDN